MLPFLSYFCHLSCLSRSSLLSFICYTRLPCTFSFGCFGCLVFPIMSEHARTITLKTPPRVNEGWERREREAGVPPVTWMIFADRDDFDRAHYDFTYAHREFLGEVRCLVFDVTPRKNAGKGRFLGRIWVEDQDFNIVRLNGTFAPRPRNGYFFHMDSWRLNLVPKYWVPAYIYSEEGDFSRRRQEPDRL